MYVNRGAGGKGLGGPSWRASAGVTLADFSVDAQAMLAYRGHVFSADGVGKYIYDTEAIVNKVRKKHFADIVTQP
jgi:hypothetical protein